MKPTLKPTHPTHPTHTPIAHYYTYLYYSRLRQPRSREPRAHGAQSDCTPYLINHVLKLGLCRVLAERPHHGAQHLGRDGTIAVLLQQANKSNSGPRRNLRVSTRWRAASGQRPVWLSWAAQHRCAGSIAHGARSCNRHSECGDTLSNREKSSLSSAIFSSIG
jgi:hypothetical protein